MSLSAELIVELFRPQPDEWNSMVSDSDGASLPQTWEYGAIKAATANRRSVEHVLVKQGTTTVGYAQAIVVRPPFGLKGGFVWINRAPLQRAAAKNPSPWIAILDAITTYYSVSRGFYIRIAPPTFMDSTSAAYRVTDVAGWASARIDLTQPDDKLRANLRGNWRYSVRKMEKTGLRADIGSDPTRFARFNTAHTQFLADRQFTTMVTPDFLERLQAILPEPRKMIVVSALDGANFVGSVLIARYGAICEYLAGNTVGDRTQSSGIGQFLLWNAMLEMKRRGCEIFDLGGMDSSRTPKGIYEFKSGVNPTPYRLANEIEAGGRGPIGRLIKAAVTRARHAE